MSLFHLPLTHNTEMACYCFRELEKEALKIALSYLLWISLSLQIETNVNSVVVTIKPQLVRTPWAVLSASVKMDIGIQLEAAEQSAKVGMNVIFTDKFKRIRC